MRNAILRNHLKYGSTPSLQIVKSDAGMLLYKHYLFPSQAALIMQVLSLTDQQISLLPADQRQSIMVLKEQIAHSTQPN